MRVILATPSIEDLAPYSKALEYFQSFKKNGDTLTKLIPQNGKDVICTFLNRSSSEAHSLKQVSKETYDMVAYSAPTVVVHTKSYVLKGIMYDVHIANRVIDGRTGAGTHFVTYDKVVSDSGIENYEIPPFGLSDKFMIETSDSVKVVAEMLLSQAEKAITKEINDDL